MKTPVKSLFKTTLMTVLTICAISCSKDMPDDPSNSDKPSSSQAETEKEETGLFKVNINKVFPDKKLSEVDGYKFTYNSDGTLKKLVKSNDQGCEFKYYQDEVVITFNFEPTVHTIHLNSNGYAQTCHSEYGNIIENWEYEYDNIGHLRGAYCKELGNYSQTFEWKDGNMIKTTISRDGYSETNITCTYSNYDSHGFALYNKCFDVDSRDINWMYFAGLLGVSCKNLPIKISSDKNWGHDYTWGLNNNLYPVKLSENDYDWGQHSISWIGESSTSTIEVLSEHENSTDPNDKQETGLIKLNIDKIFPGKKLSEVNGYKFTYNPDGSLKKAVKSDNEWCEFKYYGDDVELTVNRESSKTVHSIHLNSEGYVQTSVYKNSIYYEYEYDSTGHLIEVRQGQNNRQTFEWKDGNIIQSTDYSNSSSGETIVTYSYSDYDSHGFFLPLEIYEISRDSDWIYFAGLLGVPCKNLATASVIKKYNDTHNFTWSLNYNLYPVKFNEYSISWIEESSSPTIEIP